MRSSISTCRTRWSRCFRPSRIRPTTPTAFTISPRRRSRAGGRTATSSRARCSSRHSRIAGASRPRPSRSLRPPWRPDSFGSLAMSKISRRAYAQMFGPTVGDKVRLADTDLIIEVEKDFTLYGEEVKFGGGKVIRDGMGQSQRSRAEGAADTVITNALILDHSGIVKADIAIKAGLIAAIGKAGNPDVQPNVDIVIGPGTEVIAGEGKIVTAGGIDTHV